MDRAPIMAAQPGNLWARSLKHTLEENEYFLMTISSLNADGKTSMITGPNTLCGRL